MKHTSANVGFFALIITSLSLLWLVLQDRPAPIVFALCLSLFFSVLTPALIMVVRREIWLARIREGELLRRTFKSEAGVASHFEFMRSKYFAADDAPDKTNGLMRVSTPHDGLLLLSSIPFVLLSASMAFLLFLSPEQLSHLADGSLGATIFSVGGGAEPGPKDYENALTIAGIAFAGAFLYSLRQFLKALIAFDLSGASFLRAFVHVLFAIMLAVVTWRVLPDAGGVSRAVTKSALAFDRKAPSKDNRAVALAAAETVPSPAPLSKAVLLLAFAIGFLPDAGFAWMARKARLLTLRRSASFARRTAETPLTAICGVDFFTAYRLQERNIPNVPRLATANPIQLQVEMAAGLFTILDWVGQAQLCATAGAERFLLLKRLNLRTIFDLERAVLDPASPAGLKQMVGAALLTNDGKTSIFRDFGVRPIDVAYREFDKSLTAWVSVDVVEHLVLLMTQDLHVKALRQIWQAAEAAMDADERREAMKRASAPAAPPKLAQAKACGHDGSPVQVPFGLQAAPER